MRLFFAINFSETEKDALMNDISVLRAHCAKGEFTRRDNLHMTLAFLGETDRARLGAVRAAADATACAPFDMTVGKAGSFGDIVWLGVDGFGAEAMRRLSSALRAECRARGIAFDEKPFSPHLTLSRRTEFYGDHGVSEFSKVVKPCKLRVSSFELMESSRINGILTYTKKYSKLLTEDI